MIARPCNLWVVPISSNTCCTACGVYSMEITRNAMPPMQASRCNGSDCDYNNGVISPGNPLTYDGRRLPPWNERGASHTGGAIAVAVAVDETTQGKTSSTSTSSSSSVKITATDKKIKARTRHQRKLRVRKAASGASA